SSLVRHLDFLIQRDVGKTGVFPDIQPIRRTAPTARDTFPASDECDELSILSLRVIGARSFPALPQNTIPVSRNARIAQHLTKHTEVRVSWVIHHLLESHAKFIVAVEL